MTSKNEKTCFVIAPIGENGTETRKRSDQILEHIIRPAVEPLGYKAVRADEINEPGIITTQIINRVLEDDLVIADLTERNPNVFYELAVRHAVRKPIILMIKDGESIPFDVASARTIYLDLHDLDRVSEAKKQISEQVKALERGSGDSENPISVSLDLQRLRQSEEPEQRAIAEVVSIISEIGNNLAIFEQRLSTKIDLSQSESNRLLHDIRNYIVHSHLAPERFRVRESASLDPNKPRRRRVRQRNPSPSREELEEFSSDEVDDLAW